MVAPARVWACRAGHVTQGQTYPVDDDHDGGWCRDCGRFVTVAMHYLLLPMHATRRAPDPPGGV